MVKEIVVLKTRRAFWQYLKSHPFIIVKASSKTCGPCARIKPFFMNLFEQMPDQVALVVLDIVEGRDLATFLKVRAVPCVMNFIQGEPQDSLVGANVEKLVAFFNKTLQRVNDILYK